MLTVLKTALEVGLIYGLVALALFISFSILNIADLSTDGCFTLGCAVGAMLTIAGHPLLALPAAMAAGMLSGFITAFLQTRLGVESILAGIISNTGLYTINLAVMGFSSNVSITGRATVFSLFKALTGGSQWSTLVLLDEHTAALDPVTADKVLALTRSIVSERSISCLMITHNMHQALELGSRTLMMDAGRIVLDVSGAQRADMTVQGLIDAFAAQAGTAFDNDRVLLSTAESTET